MRFPVGNGYYVYYFPNCAALYNESFIFRVSCLLPRKIIFFITLSYFILWVGPTTVFTDLIQFNRRLARKNPHRFPYSHLSPA
jgi:hypothetical protein